MARFSWVRSSVIAATIATAAACHADDFVNPDRCIIRLALILPQSPTLNIGDTITLRAQFNNVSADCLPTDTTARSLRWATASEGTLGVIAIDSLTAHVTALMAGQMGVTARAKFKGGYSDVGIASVTVAGP